MSGKEDKPKGPFGISLRYIIIFSVLLSFLYIWANQQKKGQSSYISYSEFKELVRKGKVQQADVGMDEITATLKVNYKDKGSAVTIVIAEDGRNVIAKELEEAGVDVHLMKRPSEGFSKFFFSILPILILVIIIFWSFRVFGNIQKSQMKFGQVSKARASQELSKVTFDDAAGCDGAKEELVEIVEFLKDPLKFSRLGAKIPKGVLLMGSPGTGKTLLAKAVAGEADVPFFSLSGSEFVEVFVGVGAARVRDLFETARKNIPCIIFVDEIDAVGRHRGAGLGGGHDEREQTLNQLFVEMDGFDPRGGIIMIAATNRPDTLDPALLRPGRFDRQITVDLPDLVGREAVLRVHIRDKLLAQDVDLKVIARGTPMFSGADLANLVNEATLLASRTDKDAVGMDDFEKAKDRILMGLERKGFKINEREREIIAYHEAGHTLVAKKLRGADPIHKVTIIPRTRALGVTNQLPEEDRYLIQKTYILNKIAILMGGRAAELIKFGEPSSGAQNDIQQATSLAHTHTCKWGMSDNLGPVAWGEESESIFLGRQIVQSRGYSDRMAQEIDDEVKTLLERGQGTAERIIKKDIKAFEALAKALLEKETLNGEEVGRIIAENPPVD